MINQIQVEHHKIDLRGLTLEEMKQWVTALGEKAFRAKQIFAWVHRGVRSFEDMSDLSTVFRKTLNAHAYLDNLSLEKEFKSGKDKTVKYLFSFKDHQSVETVRMEYRHGVSACLSTQVGCRMGCTFCASTIGGLVRNVSAGEMLGQLLEIQNIGKTRVSSVVLMGSGEPLENLDEVMKFIMLASSPDGLNLGQRHFTLSTCGIVPEIYRLAEMQFQITLAVSLHSAEDEIRSRLMPINKKYPIAELLKACDYYAEKTGRRVTFEYALIQGENDHEAGAAKLAHLLKGRLCHVNLIPVNPVEERGFRASQDQSIRRFAEILKRSGIETTVRRELGSDINAACGQLRNAFINS